MAVTSRRPVGSARSGHVVVLGVHGVGLRTVEQLRGAGVEVVAVAREAVDPATSRLLESWQVRLVTGRVAEALDEADVACAAAVVCVPDDDLYAMETALTVRRLRPDVRLVVKMGNAAVGRALAEVTGAGGVLDVAALAAPSVVEACLGRRVHAIELAGRQFVVAELVAPRTGSLRELYGELAPLAVAGPVELLCPGRDHRVPAGARVTVVGPPEQVAVHGARVEPERAALLPAPGARTSGAARAAERAESGGRPGPAALARTFLTEIDSRLRRTLLCLLVLSLVSVAVLRVGYVKADGAGMTLLDAVYFTVETVGTVGYGDFNFAGQASWLRAYAVLLMIAGVALTALVFAQLTQLLVSSRIERSFGQRRVGAMRGHVVVIGLGAVGVRVLEGLLDAGRKVVVVELDEAVRHLPRARALDVPVVFGDATDAEVLASANLGSASAVAVLTNDDLANVEIGLAVRDQLGARRRDVPLVLRVFDRALGDVLEDGFGFRSVRSTAALAAPWFVGAALGLDVLGTFYVDRTPFVVGRLPVAQGGGLDGLAMGELSERTRVVAIHRAPRAGVRELEHPPRRGTRFGAGDVAYLVGPYEELLAVLRRDALAPDPPPGG